MVCVALVQLNGILSNWYSRRFGIVNAVFAQYSLYRQICQNASLRSILKMQYTGGRRLSRPSIIGIGKAYLR